LNKLPYYVSSGDIEVQERACSANMILQIVKTSLESETGEAKSNQDLLSEESNELPAGIVFSDDIKNLIQDLRDHFEGDLNPVANKAQKKILVPDGLNLDEPINEDLKDSASSDDESKGELFVASEQTGSSRKDSFEPTPEELEKV
jgi:AP-3 complex subunit delta-1